MAKLQIRVNHTPSDRYYITHRCTDCGKTVGKDDNFCAGCGADLSVLEDGGEQEVNIGHNEGKD